MERQINRTRIFRELSIEIESSHIELKRSLIQLKSSLIQLESSLIQLESSVATQNVVTLQDVNAVARQNVVITTFCNVTTFWVATSLIQLLSSLYIYN